MADNSIRLKGRLLFLAQYLMEHTDDRHKITTEELIDFFEKNGYRANRNTVHDDMVVLAECGMISLRSVTEKAKHIMLEIDGSIYRK